MQGNVQILTETDLRSFAGLDLGIVGVIEKAFVALSSGQVEMPPILSLDLHEFNGEVDVKTAYIRGFDSFAVKISPGFFNNPSIGLPSTGGLMVLFAVKTGEVQAVYLDNGYLTDIRTAAAGAVAARHLAPSEVACAGVIGTGIQARLQLRAAHLVRPFKRALVHGRDRGKSEACAQDLGYALNIKVEVANDPASLVAQSQLVVTTTPAREPVIEVGWLHPGLHITAMGSDQPGKTEIDPRAIAAADAYVCDRISQCRSSGELESAIIAGFENNIAPIELGDIVAGRVQGRKTDKDVTICDLTGTGAQDTAIANHVRSKWPQAGQSIATR